MSSAEKFIGSLLRTSAVSETKQTFAAAGLEFSYAGQVSAVRLLNFNIHL